MNRMLALMSLVGLAAASSALAQSHAFPVQFGAANPVSTTWQSLNLGPAPAGSYTSYIALFDWSSVGAGTGTSSQARMSMSSTLASGTTTTPTYGAGNVVYSSNTSTAPVGNAATTANINNLFWRGNLTNSYDGGTDFFFNARQSVASTNQNWSNLRVVLNPTVTTNFAVTGLAAPAASTDLGTLAVGSTNLNFSHTTGTNAWYKFQVDSNVNGGNTFDIFTSGPTATSFDSRLNIFKDTANGLIPVASNDDAAGASNRHSILTFGSSDPTANARPYGQSLPYTFDGRGGQTSVTGLDMFNGPAGSATLTAGDTYYVYLANFSGSSIGATLNSTSVTTIDSTTFHIDQAYTVTQGSTSSTVLNTTINFMSIPTPGSVALLGMGGLLAARRRRR